MARLFAVTRSHGPAWDDARPLEGQKGWVEHAAFMDALLAEGFVVLGGPLEGRPEALLIIRATDSEQIRARLDTDPWTAFDLLRTTSIAAWTLRLGSL
jgi:uncharacterized protein YciI